MNRLTRALSTLTFLPLSGCSHYLLPASHLVSPEAKGVPYQAQLMAGVEGSVDLTAAPTLSYPPPESPGPAVPMAQKSFLPTFGLDVAMNSKIDLGVRFEPGAPLRFPVKYQFSGLPEGKAPDGSWAAAVVGSPGILIGRNGSTSTMLVSGDLAVPVGYRLNPRHQFLATPYFSFASLSGVTGVSGATQYGAGLGYQYTLENLTLRSELAYGKGSVGSSQISGIFLGASMGLALQ